MIDTDDLRGLSSEWTRQGFLDTGAIVLAAADEIDRLRAIVDKLPKTADGVVVKHGDTVFVLAYREGVEWVCNRISPQPARMEILADCKDPYAKFPIGECYSTREAAEKAKA